MTGSAVPLTSAERSRVTDAVAAAEAGTSGEIVVLVAARAGLYRSLPLALALIVGLLVPWPLIGLTDLSAAGIATAQAATVLLILLGCLDPGWRVRLIPRLVRNRHAHEAAHREFAVRGLTGTHARTGILIYVALAERYAEIVADQGVRERVPDAQWRAIVDALLAEAERGDLAAGLVLAVRRVGDVLARELPPGNAGNELPDRIIVVE